MVEEVKFTVPVIADLRSRTLMDRHWEVLDDVLNMDLRKQGTVTFKQLMKVTLSGKIKINLAIHSQGKEERELPLNCKSIILYQV